MEKKIYKLNEIDQYDFPGLGLEVANQEVRIYGSKNQNVVFREKGDETLMYFPIKESIPCFYEYKEVSIPKKVEYLLMDLDGTSINSEDFWLEIIQDVVAYMIQDESFRFASSDEAFVRGYSVLEHLSYALKKYAKDFQEDMLKEANAKYFEIMRSRLDQIEAGTYEGEPFKTNEGLKELLCFCKENGIKVLLVTSGLIEKARPEILSACKEMGTDNPFDFYERVITAGVVLQKNNYGTMGDYSAKPHPWLYFESMKSVGGNPTNTLAVEDSSAGVLSALSAGIACIAVPGGNIKASGVNLLCEREVTDLLELKKILESQIS